MINTSLVKLEFARLGLFFTLGKITPRFLLFDLDVLDDVTVMGVVETVGLLEGEATDEIDVVVDKGGAAVGSMDVVGISVAKSSVTLIYLRTNTLHSFPIALELNVLFDPLYTEKKMFVF